MSGADRIDACWSALERHHAEIAGTHLRDLMADDPGRFDALSLTVGPFLVDYSKHRVSARDLVDRLRERGVMAMHLYPFEAIVEQLEVICRDGDLLVIMGAGPVWEVAHRFHAAEPAPC